MFRIGSILNIYSIFCIAEIKTQSYSALDQHSIYIKYFVSQNEFKTQLCLEFDQYSIYIQYLQNEVKTDWYS